MLYVAKKVTQLLLFWDEWKQTCWDSIFPCISLRRCGSGCGACYGWSHAFRGNISLFSGEWIPPRGLRPFGFFRWIVQVSFWGFHPTWCPMPVVLWSSTSAASDQTKLLVSAFNTHPIWIDTYRSCPVLSVWVVNIHQEVLLHGWERSVAAVSLLQQHIARLSIVPSSRHNEDAVGRDLDV